MSEEGRTFSDDAIEKDYRKWKEKRKEKAKAEKKEREAKADKKKKTFLYLKIIQDEIVKELMCNEYFNEYMSFTTRLNLQEAYKEIDNIAKIAKEKLKKDLTEKEYVEFIYKAYKNSEVIFIDYDKLKLNEIAEDKEE